MQIATEAGWKADDVSWQKLLERIQSYTRFASPKPSLRDWLRSRATKAALKKEGQRARKLEQLPDEVLADCQPTPQPADSEPTSRRGRYKGKQREERLAEARRGSRSRSRHTVVGLGEPGEKTRNSTEIA